MAIHLSAYPHVRKRKLIFLKFLLRPFLFVLSHSPLKGNHHCIFTDYLYLLFFDTLPHIYIPKQYKNCITEYLKFCIHGKYCMFSFHSELFLHSL